MHVYFYTKTMITLAIWTKLLVMIAYGVVLLCLFGQMLGFSHPVANAVVFLFAISVALLRLWAIRRIAVYHEVIASVYPRYEQTSFIASEFMDAGIQKFLETQGPYPGSKKMGLIRQIRKDLDLGE